MDFVHCSGSMRLLAWFSDPLDGALGERDKAPILKNWSKSHQFSFTQNILCGTYHEAPTPTLRAANLRALSFPCCWSYLLLLGGVRDALFLLAAMFTVLVRPLLLRTCFSIQARRLVRLLCSDSTIRGHGLHSAISRAAMAIARPTCREFSLVQYLCPLI